MTSIVQLVQELKLSNIMYHAIKLNWLHRNLLKQKLSFIFPIKPVLIMIIVASLGKAPHDIKLAYEDNDTALVVSQSLISSCTWDQTGTKVLMGSLVIKPISFSLIYEFPD